MSIFFILDKMQNKIIFTITLEQTRQQRAGNELIKFHLVDLAGSERPDQAEGDRRTEGIKNNMGLLAISNIIRQLSGDNSARVSYRGNMLTGSFGGNSHTLMIACVSPAEINQSESHNTLRFADVACKITNKPIVNIDPQATELQALTKEVQELKGQVLQLTSGATSR